MKWEVLMQIALSVPSGTLFYASFLNAMARNDETSGMSGTRGGVATQFMAEDNDAVYTHCYRHALNRAIGDTINENGMTKSFNFVVIVLLKDGKVHQKVQTHCNPMPCVPCTCLRSNPFSPLKKSMNMPTRVQVPDCCC